MLLNLERYHRPKSLKEALSLLTGKANGSVVPIAGGTHVVSSNNQEIKELVDLAGLRLSFIKAEPTRLRIGATATLQQIADSSKLRKPPFSILVEACQSTSVSKMIRNVATIGGELIEASPYSDIATTLLALDAEATLAINHAQAMSLPFCKFLDSGPKGALQGGLFTEVLIPAPSASVGAAFVRLSQIQSSPTIINVATLLELNDQVCTKARVAIGAVGPYPIRLTAVESALEGAIITTNQIDSVSEGVLDQIQAFSDARASAEYRRAVSSILVRRSLLASLKTATQRRKAKKGK